MNAHSQPPAQAIADLPVAATVIAAFASVLGQPALLLQAAKGAVALLVAGVILVLILPATAASSFFLVFVSFAATSHFGLNWCRVMLLGPAGLPARSLGWTGAHWRFLGYGLLLFIVMLLSTLPMTAVGSVLAALLGLAATPGEMGARVGLVMLLTFLGMIYVVARFGFIFPAVAVEENYSLRHAWQHTTGQSLRMTAALFAAGFPLALAQLLLTIVLFEGVLGVSLSEVMGPVGPEAGGAPSPAEVGGTAPSLAAVLFVNAVAALFNFLCFAVLFSLLSLAFRTCTGWVPVVSGTLPGVPDGNGRDDDAR